MNKALDWRILAIPALTLVVSISACGGGSGDGSGSGSGDGSDGSHAATVTPMTSADTTNGGQGSSDEGLVDAVARDISKSDGSELDEEQARCWATDIVKQLGPERVKELGFDTATGTVLKSLDTTTLSNDEIKQITDGYFSCVDFRKTVLDGAATPEQKKGYECIFSVVNDQQLKELFEADEFGVPLTPELTAVTEKVRTECAPDTSSATG